MPATDRAALVYELLHGMEGARFATINQELVARGLKPITRAGMDWYVQRYQFGGVRIRMQDAADKAAAAAAGAGTPALTKPDAGQDQIDAWLEQCCRREAGATSSAAALYRSWQAWAARRGIEAGSHKRLSQAILRRGITKKHSRLGSMYVGIELAP